MESSASTRQAAADSGAAQDGVIPPFSIEAPQEDLDELRRRIIATRWPSKELVDDRSQENSGVWAPITTNPSSR